MVHQDRTCCPRWTAPGARRVVFDAPVADAMSGGVRHGALPVSGKDARPARTSAATTAISASASPSAARRRRRRNGARHSRRRIRRCSLLTFSMSRTSRRVGWQGAVRSQLRARSGQGRADRSGCSVTDRFHRRYGLKSGMGQQMLSRRREEWWQGARADSRAGRVMWILEVIDSLDSHKLDSDGIVPRNISHLNGILRRRSCTPDLVT